MRRWGFCGGGSRRLGFHLDGSLLPFVDPVVLLEVGACCV